MKAEYIDHMGDDLRVVNAARVSFAKESDWEDPGTWSVDCPPELKAADKNLIGFLARGCRKGDWDQMFSDIWMAGREDEPDQITPILKHIRNMPTHWAPFAHPQITIRETVPISIARQRMKHQVGFVYNEVSRRYVSNRPEAYLPTEWRRAAEDVKQGSSNETVKVPTVHTIYGESVTLALDSYNALLALGVCPEQARFVLPQGVMTEYVVTGSLYAFANAYVQRSDPHAQKEIQTLAVEWDEIIRPLFPVSWAALVD